VRVHVFSFGSDGLNAMLGPLCVMKLSVGDVYGFLLWSFEPFISTVAAQRGILWNGEELESGVFAKCFD
jgi:hypothetical protein